MNINPVVWFELGVVQTWTTFTPKRRGFTTPGAIIYVTEAAKLKIQYF